MAATTRFRPLARCRWFSKERSRISPSRLKNTARANEFRASPLLRPAVTRRRKAGSSSRASMKRVRSILPISRKARARLEPSATPAARAIFAVGALRPCSEMMPVAAARMALRLSPLLGRVVRLLTLRLSIEYSCSLVVKRILSQPGRRAGAGVSNRTWYYVTSFAGTLEVSSSRSTVPVPHL
jgi:hypothetical protein